MSDRASMTLIVVGVAMTLTPWTPVRCSGLLLWWGVVVCAVVDIFRALLRKASKDGR